MEVRFLCPTLEVKMVADQEAENEDLEGRLEGVKEEMREVWRSRYNALSDSKGAKKRYNELMEEKEKIEEELGYSNDTEDSTDNHYQPMDQTKRNLRGVFREYEGELHVVGSRIWRKWNVKTRIGDSDIEGVRTLCGTYLTQGSISSFTIHPDDDRVCSDCIDKLQEWKEEEYDFDTERYIDQQ